MIEIQDFRGFIFEDHLLSTLELHMCSDCFKKIQVFNFFVDDKLPAITAKITSLENLYAYRI